MLILLAGVPKTGKTVSACTFPKPLLYLDMEEKGFASVQNTTGPDGKLLCGDLAGIEVREFEKVADFSLSLKTATSDDFKDKKVPSYARKSERNIAEFNKVLNELDQTPGKYKTLVIDSATNLWRMLKNALKVANRIPQLRIADYMTLEGILYDQLIPQLKSLSYSLDWIILIVHEDMEKDELTGALHEFPVGPSRAQGRVMSREFDEVYRQVIQDGNYIWRTRAHGMFSGAGSRMNLPDPIDANYAALAAELQRRSNNA